MAGMASDAAPAAMADFFKNDLLFMVNWVSSPECSEDSPKIVLNLGPCTLEKTLYTLPDETNVCCSSAVVPDFGLVSANHLRQVFYRSNDAD
jgi:hypothetical protein